MAANDTERRVVIKTFGPHWDDNQVWFITAGGAIFAAKPVEVVAAISWTVGLDCFVAFGSSQ